LSKFSNYSLSSSIDGKVKLAIIAISVTRIIIMVGIGLSNSATKGAQTVTLRLTKLQMPRPVALFSSGKVLESA